jgi:hypothetical protein
MKNINSNLKFFVLLVFLMSTMLNCEYQETDFGYDGTIKGVIKDTEGNPVYGDILVNDIVVNLLGEGDQQAIQVRVDGAGEFMNTKIFPKVYKISITGPVVPPAELTHDFSVTNELTKEFVVTPFITPKAIKATVTGTSVDVEYAIVVSAGKSITKSEIYCSTAKYPTASIGNYGTTYVTKTASLGTSIAGTATITGLVPGKRYFIRVGSLSVGSTLFNYSNQIEINP